MKKWLSLLMTLALFLSCVSANAEFYYTTDSVTDCANTNAMYDKFYAAGELSVRVPGCTQDLVPQGLDYLESENWMLFDGYSSGTRNSSIIAVDMETNEVVKEVFLLNVDGTAYTGHAGGLCITEKNLYISNNNHFYRISLEKFLALPASSECAFDEAIPVPSRASYCSYANGILWIGEFEYGSDYKTDASHRAKSADGYQRAWICGYELDQSTENELKASSITAEGAVPDYILSTTERIQGMTFSSNQFYLSQSYGRNASSVFYRYSNVLKNEPAQQVDLYGKTVPLWFLDSTVKTGALFAPPMSENLCESGGDIYIVFESCSPKYADAKNRMDRVFKLTDF